MPEKHRSRLASIAIIGLLLVTGLSAVIHSFRSNRREEGQIHARYQQMRMALSSNDTNTAIALIAPDYRSRFGPHEFNLLSGFAQPLGARSSITLFGSSARVCPIRTSHFLVVPGGHTVGMIKVNEEWFFTGEVHID